MHSGAAGDFKPSRLSGGPEQRDLSGRLGSDKIITSLKLGKISFQDLQEGKASMKELLEYVPLNTDGIRELHIFDVPSKSSQSTVRLFIKEEKLFDSQGEILTTQINDPLYQAHLKEFRNTQHYSLDFVDEQRPITSSKILQAKQDVETLYQLNELFNDWYTGDMDDEAINDFFDKLSDSQRRFLGVEARQFEKIPEEIDELYRLAGGEEPSSLERATNVLVSIESLESQLLKPTISSRLSAEGEIGELKSINIQSSAMSGSCLMQVFDTVSKFLGAQAVYLSDEAKFEKEDLGSYNMRLFRYFVDDKHSWYTDSFGYNPYHFDPLQQKIVNDNLSYGDPVHDGVKIFRDKTVGQLKEELQDSGFDPKKKNDLLQVVEKHGENCNTVGDLINKLAQKAKEGETVHSELHILLTIYLELYKGYKGDSKAINLQKEKAEIILKAIYFRKGY